MILEIRNAISEDLCDQIISKFETKDLVYRNRPEYKFKEMNMASHEDMVNLQMELIRATTPHIKDISEFFPDQYGYEAVRIKRYDEEDEFPWHVDVRDYDSARRFLVCMFYLNHDFTGGETEFGNSEEIKYTVTPEKCKMIIFEPLWTNPHRGCKVRRGSKYIANVYYHYL